MKGVGLNRFAVRRRLALKSNSSRASRRAENLGQTSSSILLQRSGAPAKNRKRRRTKRHGHYYLERFSGNPDVEKARSEFERAQKIEETFHRDFDGIDFTSSGNSPLAGLAGTQLSLDLSVAQRVGFVLALL
jgi:hypothetical protein